LRWLGMMFASLTMLCLFCAPTPAQSSPSASQYRDGGSGYCPPGNLCAQSVNDGPEVFSENAEQGTDAVNDAMSEPEASAPTEPDDASAPAGSVPPEGGPAGTEAGGPGGITSLPETGGAPLTVLGSGAVLASLGFLMAREVVGR
jgi:hypothetical protein